MLVSVPNPNSLTVHSRADPNPSEGDPSFGASGGIPLSFAQQRLWFLERLQPGTALYNVPLALRLRGRLSHSALQLALSGVIARHEALRTNVVCRDGFPEQRIHPPQKIAIPLTGLSDRPAEQRESELHELLRREARRPFDLAADRLLRPRLFALGEDDHVLLLTLHHLVCDEWSMRLLWQELALQYQAICRGESATLPELPVQYPDYAVWQREWMASSASARQLDYWRVRLRGAAPRLELPTDHRPGPSRSLAGRRHVRELPKTLTDSLRELSRRADTTLFITLLASFKALLARYSAQDDILLGSPMAGRTRVETENLIGFFVNSVVLRTDLSGDPTFLETLRRVRETTLGAYDHQDFPFDRLVEALRPARTDGNVPFLQVMFAFEQSMDTFHLPGLAVEWLDVDTGTAKFDLTWAVREVRSTLSCCVEYSVELFADETVRRLTEHWQNLLQGILADPGQRLSQINLLHPAERRRLLVEWNETTRPYPETETISARFEAQAQRRGSAIALQYPGGTLSYAQLNERANEVARILHGLGIREETPVAICAEPSAEWVIGLLGILKAGGTYVPLDPSYPVERLRLILSDTRAAVLLTQKHLQPALPSTPAAVVCLDALPPVPAIALPAPGSPDLLAYIVYTSGSSGQPKGVSIPHRAVVRLVCNTDYAQLGPDDRVAQASNASFDAATFEVWGALLNGATLVGVPREVSLAPKEFAAFLIRERVTTLFLTTALFNQMADHCPGAFRHLRHLLFGGEAVDPKRVRAVRQHAPPARLLHVYGPTESTTFASWHLVTDVPADAPTVPIGRPIANTRIYLLDRWLQPVPVGVAGQIYIGGPGLARGYLNQPELTAEKFVPNPFEPGGRLYKTGDLARFRPDGHLEFIGRADGQVKIRGFRVEPGEIECALAAHPAVGQTIVLAREDDRSVGRQLVAYLTLKSGNAGQALAGIRQYLKEKLPSYMVPAHLVLLPRMPLNANGKVDRNALPPLQGNRLESAPRLHPPRNPTEEKLVALWKEVLGLDDVGVRDNFFDLGGHSLLAVRLFSGIEREFGKKLPLATLFRCPTVEHLAQRIEADDPASTWPLIVDIQPHGSRLPVFWIHSLGGDGGGAFFYYRRLAQLLGPDQPSFGIRSPQVPLQSIPAMAARYVDELLRFQPQGPYLIGGFCFGGIVAFEMACELQRRGREVGLLALLESGAPPGAATHRAWRVSQAGALVRNLRAWLLDLLGNPSELTLRLHRKIKALQKRLQRPFQPGNRATAATLDDLIDMSEYPSDYVRYAQAHWHALTDYQPRPYPGRITLFRARKQPLLSVDPTLGWGSLAADSIAVNVIPGTHEKMLEEPNVQILAAELKTCLVEAQPAGLGDLPEPANREKAPQREARPPCAVIT